MTNFKFGDRVRHTKHGTGFVIHHVANTAEVMFADRSYRDVQATDIELIPHPDTVRLDFIISQVDKNNTVNFYQDKDDYGDEIQFCEISFCEDRGYDEVAFHSNSVRDVIDFAIESELEHMFPDERDCFFDYIYNK